MKSKKRRYLGLESLEARWVPATIQYSGGNLYISNLTLRTGNTSTVTVTEATTGNTFTVQDGTGSKSSYAVSGNIYITGNNAKDTIGVSLNAGTGLTGNLVISTGSGASSVTVDGETGGGGPGLLAGITQISLGLGGGTVNLGTGFGLNDRGTLSVTAGANSSNTLVLGNATTASTFAGSNLNFTNFNNVTIGQGAADNIPANITVNAANNGNAGTITLGKTETVLGNFSIYGGSNSTTININGAAVNGTLTVNDKGPSSLTFGSGGTTSVGALNYTSLNGNTAFTASGAAGTALTVQTNAQFNWGNGANSFGSSSSFTVNNNFFVTNGSGGLDINTNAFQGSVGGTFTVNSGNGTTNAVTLNNTAAEAGGGTGVSAFNYGQNNGGNSVTVTDAGTGHLVSLNIHFGSSGANLFTISAGTPAALTGQVAWSTSTTATVGNGFANPGNYAFTLPWSFFNEP